MAYVVRVTHPEKGDRFKVFRDLRDARELFEAAYRLVPDERDAAYLYVVSGQSDPYAALDAVKAGNATLLDRDPFSELTELSSEEIDALLKKAGL